MNTLVTRRVRFVVGSSLGLLALVVLAGCASKAKQPAGDLVLETAEPGVTTKDYKYVTRLGSHIPVRVPTDGNIRLAPGASPVEYLSGEVLKEITTRPTARPR